MTNEDKQFFEQLFGGLENMEKGFGYDYNIFCCEQAILISELGSKEAIVDFNKQDWSKQKEMVPDYLTTIVVILLEWHVD